MNMVSYSAAVGETGAATTSLAQQLLQVMEDLKKEAKGILGEWEGEAAQEFEVAAAKWHTAITQFSGGLNDLGMRTQEAFEGIKQTDRHLRGVFEGLGG